MAFWILHLDQNDIGYKEKEYIEITENSMETFRSILRANLNFPSRGVLLKISALPGQRRPVELRGNNIVVLT